MGLAFHRMLWCYCFTDFVKSLYCYRQNGGKTTKTLGVLMDKQNHPTFPYRPPNLLVLKWTKKNPRPHLLTFGYCWWALARQLPILYNREKKPKSVGCKIGDLHSKFAFNIRGLLNVETCAVDYGCLWMHVELSIHFKLKEGQDNGGETFLHLCHQLLV